MRPRPVGLGAWALLGASALLLAAGPAASRRLDCERLAAEGTPRLSAQGREAVQLQILVERTERELDRRLPTEELAAAFAARLESLLACDAAARAFTRGRPEAALVQGRLALSGNGRARELPCRGELAGLVAAEAVRRLASWCAPPGERRAEAEHLLWAAWVEGLLDRVGRPFTDYAYADELERVVRRAFGRGPRAPAVELLPAAPVSYLVLRRFEPRAVPRLADCLQRAESVGATGLVIDLRGNSGGRVQLAPLALLLPEGAVMARRHALGEDEVEVLRAPGGATELALVLLVDGGTASMAELFAASLQDAGRARLVGARTWGKGLGQSLHAVGGEGLLVLDAREYDLPGGDGSWTGTGLAPDFPLDEPGRAPASLAGRDLAGLAADDPALALALELLAPTS